MANHTITYVDCAVLLLRRPRGVRHDGWPTLPIMLPFGVAHPSRRLQRMGLFGSAIRAPSRGPFEIGSVLMPDAVRTLVPIRLLREWHDAPSTCHPHNLKGKGWAARPMASEEH